MSSAEVALPSSSTGRVPRKLRGGWRCAGAARRRRADCRSGTMRGRRSRQRLSMNSQACVARAARDDVPARRCQRDRRRCCWRRLSSEQHHPCWPTRVSWPRSHGSGSEHSVAPSEQDAALLGSRRGAMRFTRVLLPLLDGADQADRRFAGRDLEAASLRQPRRPGRDSGSTTASKRSAASGRGAVRAARRGCLAREGVE